jgi:glutamine synthetase
MNALGPLRSAGYLAVKRAEAAEFARHDAAYECARHFIVF